MSDGDNGFSMIEGDRPTLTAGALRRWSPALARRAPDLLSAYMVPGRVGPPLREATMLGVTSINRCRACARVHQRWGRAVGLEIDDPRGLESGEAAAYAYGQALALDGPRTASPPVSLSPRHRRELEAAGVLMQLANLAGNRFLPGQGPIESLQIRGAWTARLYDVAMRAVDRTGLRRARSRVAGGAAGDVLEIGIGTGLNLASYPVDASLHAIDPSQPALDVAARRADRLGRPVVLTAGDAADLPFPDASFDVVVGTFVLCSVGDVALTLRESRRVLRPGGRMRFLEHGRSRRRAIARIQTCLATAWSRASGGCRLDHDVRSAMEAAGLRIVEDRSRGGGVLVEIVAAVA
ncbi:MAG: class I SAM-dependent methyltransferase [Chloroflexota bacterium]